MALCKEITTIYGVNATYHKISLININWHLKQCEFQLDSYISQESREQGMMPIYSQRYFYNSSRPDVEDKFDFDVNTNLVAQLYNKVKLESEYQDATDC